MPLDQLPAAVQRFVLLQHIGFYDLVQLRRVSRHFRALADQQLQNNEVWLGLQELRTLPTTHPNPRDQAIFLATRASALKNRADQTSDNPDLARKWWAEGWQTLYMRTFGMLRQRMDNWNDIPDVTRTHIHNRVIMEPPNSLVPNENAGTQVHVSVSMEDVDFDSIEWEDEERIASTSSSSAASTSSSSSASSSASNSGPNKRSKLGKD